MRLSLSLMASNIFISSPKPNKRSPDIIAEINMDILNHVSISDNKNPNPTNIIIAPMILSSTDTTLLDSGICSSATFINSCLFGAFIAALQAEQNLSPSLISLPHHSHFIKSTPIIIYILYIGCYLKN